MLKKLQIQFFWMALLSVNLLSDINAQTPNIVLGRPTNNAMTVSVMFSQNMEFYLEYGTLSGTYTWQTYSVTHTANTPNEVDITNLTPNTKYFYRVKYRQASTSAYTNSPEYSFRTQRSAGSTFTFTIETDEHLYDKKGVTSLYQIALNNQAEDKPDFMLSLGDIFGDDHNPTTITDTELNDLHKFYRPYLGTICHSIPFYVCLGNHEGEFDYYLNQNPPNNLAVMGTKWRKFYYPNPSPNAFYTGNTTVEGFGIGNPENYYAWTWGDALFVVLDVYRDQCDTSATPRKWDWSLGAPQYNWLKTTLETSTAKYKFVFAHHVRGLGRGGITNARYYEWGGYEENGSSRYTFPTKRPGWAKPIHQLFVDNGVNIFFQGHDHVYSHEVLNGVTYQACPMPADTTYQIGMLANADAYTADTIAGSGHIRVAVSDACVKVDFVRAYQPIDTLGSHKNREVAFSYTIGTCAPVSGVESASQDIKVFPNPTYNSVSIELPQSSNLCSVKLTNTLGQTLIETQQTPEVQLGHLPNGLYFMHIKTDNQLVVHKVLKQ